MINIGSIKKNFGASTLGVLVNIIFQLLAVPIFIKLWGVEYYGEWLMLSAVSAYFSMSDVGINTVTANEFSIHYAQKNLKKCKTLLNNNLFIVISIFFFVTVLLIVSLNLSDFTKIFNFRIIPERIAETSLIILTIKIFTGILSNVFNSIYRANQIFARGLMIDNCVRICENIILIVGVVLKYKLVLILVFYSSPVLFGLFIKYFDTKKYFKVSFNYNSIDKVEIKKILTPSIAFLSMPVGNSIILQGFTLIVGAVLGSASVVLFNTTRTLVNFLKSALGLINNSVWPELSLLYGRGNMNEVKKIMWFTVGTSFYLSLGLSVILFTIGKYIYIYWTKSAIEFNQTLFIMFLIIMIFNTIWFASSVILFATNKHKKYSLIYLISSILSILVGYIYLKLFNDVSYLPLSLLVMDIFLILAVGKLVVKIIGGNVFYFYYMALITPIKYLKSFFP
jgi:O-antigen/teichoic acid export membrane protein